MGRRRLDVGRALVPQRVEQIAHQAPAQPRPARLELDLEVTRAQKPAARIAQEDELPEEREQQELRTRLLELDHVFDAVLDRRGILDRQLQQRLGRPREGLLEAPTPTRSSLDPPPS